MTGTFKSIGALFQDTSQVGANRRHRLNPLMIPVYKQIMFFEKGVGIYRKLPWITQRNTPLSPRPVSERTAEGS